MTAVTPDAAHVTRVKSLTAWDQRPAVTEPEVIAALQQFPKVDRDGLTPEDGDWTQTWDIYAAVAEVWRIKAGKVAGDFNFSADNGRYDKGEVLAHCLAMEAKYAAMAMGSTPTTAVRDDLAGVIVNG